MSDNDNIWGSIFGALALGGMYAWGKSKGYEKSTFEHNSKLQQMEIDYLKEQLAQMQKQIGLNCKDKIANECIEFDKNQVKKQD